MPHLMAAALSLVISERASITADGEGSFDSDIPNPLGFVVAAALLLCF